MPRYELQRFKDIPSNSSNTVTAYKYIFRSNTIKFDIISWK